MTDNRKYSTDEIELRADVREILHSIIEDGYLSETNGNRARAALDKIEFMATLEGAAREATDGWIAGFIRQHFGVYLAPQVAQSATLKKPDLTDYSAPVLCFNGTLGVSQTKQTAVLEGDYKLRALCKDMLKMYKERGSVTAMHMDAMRDIIADSPPAAAQELCDCCKDIRDAEEIHGEGPASVKEAMACCARDALAELVNQIRKTSPVDGHGHDMKMNMAYIKAVQLLGAIDTSPITGITPSPSAAQVGGTHDGSKCPSNVAQCAQEADDSQKGGA